MNSKKITSVDLRGNKYEIPVEQLSWRPSAYAIIARRDKVLLVKAKGRYHLPGGGIDLGETPEITVIREVNEETGLVVTSPILVGLLTSFFAYDAYGSQEVRHVQSLLLYYACVPVGGEISTGGLEDYEKAMGVQAEWVPIDKLGEKTIGTSVDWRPIVRKAQAAAPE
jgi:ADP-ribose pyrophosphatase YjhB (NUDIX family)